MPAELDYQHPETPYIPPPWARWWIEPLRGKWRWLPTLLAISPFFFSYVGSNSGPLDPALLYAFVIVALFLIAFGGGAITALAFLRAILGTAIRKRYRLNQLAEVDSRPYISAIWIMVVLCILIWTGMPMRIAFLIRLHAMNALREHVEQTGTTHGREVVLPFVFSGAEKVYSEEDGRYVIVFYTSGSGFPGGGSGFIYVPEGTPFPGYNRGNDGWLFGRWYWFVTD